MAHPPSASAVASSSFTSTAPPFSNTSDTGNSTEQPSIQARARRRPLSVQDVNEIDAWLARLHRLEGAQPPKESLPSRPSAIVRSASHTIETKSSSRQVEYSWNVNSNSSQSNILGHKHTRRRSLAFFTTAGTSNHLSDQVDRSHSPSSAPISHIQHSPSHGLARSGSCSPTYLAIDTPDDLTSSPRPSSHLEPACAARASIPFVSQAATATLLDKEERIYEEQREECDDPHEKEYYEVQDGSYIVLTEVGSVGSGAVESGRAHSTVHYEAIEGNNETDSHITQSTPTQEVQVSQIMSSSLPDAFNPTATISSSRSIKSFSTTSSNNTPSSSNGISGSNNITSGNSTAGNSKLQPRSPLSSPKATLSLKKGRKELSTQGVEVQSDEEEDEEAAHINVATDSNTIMKSEIQGTEHHRIASSSSGITGPLARAKKLSKSSFTSSIDSVRGSIISPASNHSPSSSLIFEKQQTGGGAGAGGRRESSDSRASSHSFPHHKHFFNRNSSKHPQTGHTQSQAQYQNPDDIETSSPKPIKAKLIARDERFYSSRGRERPRLTSARSASSLQLGGEGTRGGGVESENEGNTAEDGENEEDDDDEEALFNPRRASISSTSPSHQRSKDDKRTLLASSSSNKNHRISLAIPPPLIRSYSYDNRITAASLATSSIIAKSVLESNSGNSLDTSELARHIPDLKQNILLWVPVDEHTGANLSYHSSSYAGAGAGMSRSPSSSHNHHGPTHHHPSSSTAKGLANVLLSNVPIVNSRKKLIRRESTQVLFSDDIHEEGETVHHNKHTDFKHQQHSEEGKEKYKRKLHHHSAEKGKGRASILIPSGQWRKGEAVLKSNGSLVISSGTICLASVQLSTLQRTDIRLVDPSLLGRQRCISLHIENGFYIAPPSYSPSYEKRTTPNFPISPSAPDFFSFASLTNSSNSNSMTRSVSNTGLLDDALSVSEGGQTLFLAFPSTALQHAWIASMLCHAQAEVWPTSAISNTPATVTEEEVSSEASENEKDAELPKSPRTRPQFLQHGSWRKGLQVDPSTQYPIRMYRSVSLQIIQARCSKEHQNPSLSQSLAALAMHSLPTTPVSPDGVHVQKRSGSIASIKTTETGSSGGEGQNHIDGSSGAMPSHLKQALMAQQQQQQQQQQYTPSIPTSSSIPSKKVESSNTKESKKEENMDLFCEIWLDGEILGRTGVRHLGTKTIWEETFNFNNLGPYKHPLDIHIFTIRKHQVQLAGKVLLPLPTMQRNKPVEGWFEMRPPEFVIKKGHLDCLGELNLRVMAKEDIALPYQAYSSLGSLIAEDMGTTAILSILDAPQIELDLFAQLLLRIDTAHRRVLQRIMSLCEKEVQNTDNIATLFRGNTLLTKTVEMHMRSVGSDYLDNTVGPVLRRLCEERIFIEIDPSRLDHRSSLHENVRNLETWCDAVWSSIYNSRHSCPIEVRRSLRKIRQIVDAHCVEEQDRGRLSEEERSRARFTSVSAFISLRFFCPAILRPNLFRLCPSHPPDAKTSRTLTLIAKVLMGMANMQTFGSKEPWMSAMNPFLQNNLSSYQDFITYLCSKEEGTKSDWTEKDFEPYKIPVLKRMTLAPDIVKEGVPELPFLVDLPKEYAALAALVATAEPAKPQPGINDAIEEDSQVEELPHQALLNLCRALHSQARSRVRALVRTGELPAPGVETNRRMFARTEQVRLPGRVRGSTVSKAISTPSPERTAILSKSTHPSSAESSRAALFASSPVSTASVCGAGNRFADPSASTSSSIDSSSESQVSVSSPNRPKRRSYTVSASPSLSKSETLPGLVSSTFSRSLPVPPVEEDDNASDILDIKNPISTPSSPNQAIKEVSPRRLTIVAPRPLTLESASQLPAVPGMKTPRAPTFSQEQRENLRELQEAFIMSAFDNPASAIGVMPSARDEPPLSPSAAVPPPKRKLFRKK